MREIHLHPVFDSSTLSSQAKWATSDVVQLVQSELSGDDMSRIWEILSPKYRLSVAYIARVVRIDTIR